MLDDHLPVFHAVIVRVLLWLTDIREKESWSWQDLVCTAALQDFLTHGHYHIFMLEYTCVHWCRGAYMFAQALCVCMHVRVVEFVHFFYAKCCAYPSKCLVLLLCCTPNWPAFTHSPSRLTKPSSHTHCRQGVSDLYTCTSSACTQSHTDIQCILLCCVIIYTTYCIPTGNHCMRDMENMRV